MQQGLTSSRPQLWEAAVGKPGEGRGGEKEPLCHTIPSLVPRLCCCQRQTTLQTAGGGRGPAAAAPLGTEQPHSQGDTGVHQLCCTSKEAEAQGVPLFPQGCWHTGGRSCDRLSALPGPHSSCQPQLPSLISPVHVGSGGTGCGDGRHRQLTSAQGQKTALGKKTSPLPCPSILPRQLPWLPWAHRGHQDLTGSRAECQWAVLWDKVPKTPARAPQCPPASAHTHPWCWTWPTPPTARSLPGCCVRSHALPGGPTPWIPPSGCLSGSPAKKRAL